MYSVNSAGIRHIVLGAAASAALMGQYCSMTYADTPFDTVGYVRTVDPEHQKLIVNSGDKLYLIDMRQAKVHLVTSGINSPEIGDLVIGMRVDVVGTELSSSFVAANIVQVLPYIPPGTECVAATDAPTPFKSQPDDGFSPAMGVSPTVSSDDGALEPPAIPPASNQLIAVSGSVTTEATFISRSIKVATKGGVLSVAVPRGIPIEAGVSPVSVHDLKSGMSLSITGHPEPNNSFDATSIEVNSPQ